MKSRLFLHVGWLAVVTFATPSIASDSLSRERPSNRRSPAAQKDSNTIEVESILDRLEKKLTDNEAGGLTFSEKMEPVAKDSAIPKPATKYKFSNDAESANPASPGNTMKELAEAVASLEVQVERLHSDIQKARLKVIEDARVDNFVQIDAEFRGLDTATLKSLVVKIDGVEVYRASDAGGLWVPSSRLPLFSGPVPPGNHKLQVEAGILVRENSNVPVSPDVTRRLEKEFQFSIPDGKERRTMGVVIDAPSRPETKGNISLTGSDGVKL